MPISGLILTLSKNPHLKLKAVNAISQCKTLELGDQEGSRVAAVMSTRDSDADRETMKWLTNMPGVEHIDITFIGFNDPPAPKSTSPRTSPRS